MAGRRGIIVDVGKSGVRAAFAGDAARLTVAHARGVLPTSRHDPADELLAVLGPVLVELLADPAGSGRFDAVVIGTTTELTAGECASIASGVRRLVDVSAVGLCHDGLIAHAAALGGHGVLLSVGTGVIAVTMDRVGALGRCDGWGPVAGDRGGAVDVGRLAIRQVFEDFDAGVETPLADAVAELIGPLDVATGKQLCQRDDWPQLFAAVGGIVVGRAQAGDAVAGELLDVAVAALCRTADAARARTGPAPLAVSGRFGTTPAMADRLSPALIATGWELLPSRSPLAADPAALIAGPYRAGLTYCDGG